MMVGWVGKISHDNMRMKMGDASPVIPEIADAHTNSKAR